LIEEEILRTMKKVGSIGKVSIRVLMCSELKTLEWDILNPDRIINLEIKNERRTCNI